MADFLQGYGETDARRERIVKRFLITVVLAAIVGIAGWFFFRDFTEERQISRFLSLLEEKNYREAYRLWGCDPDDPCRDYAYAKFLEDWGPEGLYTRRQQLKKGTKRSCEGAIIQFLEYGPTEDDVVYIYVQRSGLSLSFAPWPVCNPRWQAPTAP